MNNINKPKPKLKIKKINQDQDCFSCKDYKRFDEKFWLFGRCNCKNSLNKKSNKIVYYNYKSCSFYKG